MMIRKTRTSPLATVNLGVLILCSSCFKDDRGIGSESKGPNPGQQTVSPIPTNNDDPTETTDPESSEASSGTSDTAEDTDSPSAEDSESDSENDDDNDDDNDDNNSVLDIEPTEKWDIGTIPDFMPPERGCTIDFLFVIDNSGSMADEQDNLAQSVPQFIEILQNTVELEKFHLGVTTSESYIGNTLECTSLGSLVKKTAGMESSNMSCAPYADGFGYMTPNDDLSVKFPCAAKPGIGGASDEKPMEAMMNAIGTDLAAPGACNEGFIRDDETLLVITIITDEEDNHELEMNLGLNEGSQGDPMDWYNSVIQAKGQEENVVVLSLIGTEEPNECIITNPPGMPTFDGAEISERIKEFTELFGERGFVGDVCAASYGEFFKQAVEIIDFACENIPQG